jgi:hypothetical protein
MLQLSSSAPIVLTGSGAYISMRSTLKVNVLVLELDVHILRFNDPY